MYDTAPYVRELEVAEPHDIGRRHGHRLSTSQGNNQQTCKDIHFRLQSVVQSGREDEAGCTDTLPNRSGGYLAVSSQLVNCCLFDVDHNHRRPQNPLIMHDADLSNSLADTVRAAAAGARRSRYVAADQAVLYRDLSRHAARRSAAPRNCQLRADRAGDHGARRTPLAEIDAALGGAPADARLRAPHFGKTATSAGAIACGFPGRRRSVCRPVPAIFVLGSPHHSMAAARS